MGFLPWPLFITILFRDKTFISRIVILETHLHKQEKSNRILL